MKTMYRFTDWYYEQNDSWFDTFEEAEECFNKFVEDNPEGRYSIWAITEHEEGEFEEEGVYFNENCPEYEVI